MGKRNVNCTVQILVFLFSLYLHSPYQTHLFSSLSKILCCELFVFYRPIMDRLYFHVLFPSLCWTHQLRNSCVHSLLCSKFVSVSSSFLWFSYLCFITRL